MSAAPRVVLDTNVALSALTFPRGRLAPLRLAWQQSRCHPLISRLTAAELVRALAYPKFRLSPGEQQELLADYLPYCTTVSVPDKPVKVPPCRDPFDIPFLQLAIVGKANHLVTGDKDLLSMAPGFSRSIITPGELLELLSTGR